MRGRIELRFLIGRDGRVPAVSPKFPNTPEGAGDLTDPAVVGCIVAVFRKLTFPRPEGDGVVTVSYPIVFSPYDHHPPNVDPARAGVSLGHVQLTGAGRTTVARVGRAAEMRIETLRDCYAQALGTAPSLRGQVVVTFLVNELGKTSIQQTSGDIDDPALVNCVARAYSGASFDPPEGGPVSVTLPVRFFPIDGS